MVELNKLNDYQQNYLKKYGFHSCHDEPPHNEESLLERENGQQQLPPTVHNVTETEEK